MATTVAEQEDDVSGPAEPVDGDGPGPSAFQPDDTGDQHGNEREQRDDHRARRPTRR